MQRKHQLRKMRLCCFLWQACAKQVKQAGLAHGNNRPERDGGGCWGSWTFTSCRDLRLQGQETQRRECGSSDRETLAAKQSLLEASGLCMCRSKQVRNVVESKSGTVPADAEEQACGWEKPV